MVAKLALCVSDERPVRVRATPFVEVASDSINSKSESKRVRRKRAATCGRRLMRRITGFGRMLRISLYRCTKQPSALASRNPTSPRSTVTRPHVVAAASRTSSASLRKKSKSPRKTIVASWSGSPSAMALMGGAFSSGTAAGSLMIGSGSSERLSACAQEARV